MDIIESMKKELLRRKYSIKTVKIYIYYVKRFLNHIKKEPKRINISDVKEYLNFLSKDNSGSTLNVNLMAIKFMMEEILHKRKYYYDIKFSKTPRKLPVVLTQEEVKNLIRTIDNPKQKLMIKLMYSSGLRVSELVRLKVKDLEIENGFGWVRGGKGNKDRLFIIARSIKEELRNFIQNKKDWVFQGQLGHYSTKSIYIIIKRAAKSAKINKNISPHTLRHSFSTHLIENGYDVTSVQALLGHKSPETTMIYVHIAKPNMLNIKSPLDTLMTK
jgi:site-specific recombinase XerD